MISDVDIKDWEWGELKELYQVPNKTYVKLEDVPNEVLFFDHIDGMYSYCKDLADNVVHLFVGAKVRERINYQMELNLE